MSRSMTGVTVLDLSHALSGPFSTMLMAELGANGHQGRTAGRRSLSTSQWRRNVRGGQSQQAQHFHSISRSLTAEEIMQRLIAKADVMLEAFTPGAAERLGYGYEAVAELKPDIIYCSISGFGQSGSLQRTCAAMMPWPRRCPA